MLYILDTDICSYIIRGDNLMLLDNLKNHADENIAVTSITVAELLFGAKKISSQKILKKIDAILKRVTIIDFDENSAVFYSDIRNKLEKAGTPIGNMDILIASCALSKKAILVTNNEKHFSYIEGLKIENWTK